jgi:hypothetical protein
MKQTITADIFEIGKKPTLDEMANSEGLFIFQDSGPERRGMIEIRESEEYQDRAFYLNSQFNWKIQEDSEGHLCLIPTPK